MKICNKCKIEKEENCFNLSSYNKEGLDTHCKNCRCEYKKSRKDIDNKTRRENRLKNKDIVNQKQYNYARENPEWYLLTKAKERAKLKGLEFNIEIEDIKIPQFCPILEIELVKGTSKDYQRSPSIDRIDSSKGYIKGNIKVISTLANTMKSSANKELLQIFSKNIISYLDNDIV